MSAAAHLAKFDVTVEHAYNFIMANVEQPGVIFNAAAEFAVTTAMLSEITQFSPEVIGNYFASFGLDTRKLDHTHILINSDPGDLGSLITFNERTGILSNESLRGFVQQSLSDPSQYDSVFGPQFAFQADDEVYDAEELGVATLTNVSATTESIESLFYGSLINMFSRFDQIELNQIILFPAAERRNSDDFQAFVFEALSDIPLTVPIPDDELAGLVVREAAILITELLEDSTIVGVLDQSFLGLAVA